MRNLRHWNTSCNCHIRRYTRESFVERLERKIRSNSLCLLVAVAMVASLPSSSLFSLQNLLSISLSLSLAVMPALCLHSTGCKSTTCNSGILSIVTTLIRRTCLLFCLLFSLCSLLFILLRQPIAGGSVQPPGYYATPSSSRTA
ncbi:hypothetical protein B0T26DRAFT_706995 [Lasiosphaeria miniovina]|uniref:Transmembrane protein n=1 Tax=Lasiosphaeria miniovina TaxID=1954250 RepID=A0AA40E4E7_9PEZI|nr:uncharacterized protein B0T26DRAFT_706995 [Lasiosphaeria miniovina]KAK0723621.1 hypothetical protein B0T26DRAFT_706995 [Lasiosphaeria miniovina]